jgi:hypothetical protein
MAVICARTDSGVWLSWCVWMNRKADWGQRLFTHHPSLPNVDAAPTRQRLASEEKVLRYCQVWRLAEHLIDDANPERLGMARVARLDRIPIEENPPVVAGVGSAQNLHQRGFTSAILTEQYMHFPGSDTEVHSIERLHAGKALRDPSDLEGWPAADGQFGLDFDRHGTFLLRASGEQYPN